MERGAKPAQPRDGVHTYRKAIFSEGILSWALLLVVALVLVGFAFLGRFGSMDRMGPIDKIGAIAVIVGVAFVPALLLIGELSYRVMLSPDGIAVSRWGRIRILPRYQIAGVRDQRIRGRRFVWVVPRDPQARPLMLGLGLATDEAFETWLSQFDDIDARDLETSKEELLSDPDFGATPDERLARLDRAKTIMKWLSGVAMVIAAWCAFFPWPYGLAVFAAAITPVAIALVVANSGGVIRFMKKPTEAYAGPASSPVGFCVMALGLRIYRDVYLVDWPVALLGGGGIGLILLAGALMIDRSLMQRRWATLVAAALIAIGYGVAIAVLADVNLDRSAGMDFRAYVLSSRVSRGKITRYLVRLTPWGSQEASTELEVPGTVFEGLTSGKDACIVLHDGVLGMRWFTVWPCARR